MFRKIEFTLVEQQSLGLPFLLSAKAQSARSLLLGDELYATTTALKSSVVFIAEISRSLHKTSRRHKNSVRPNDGERFNPRCCKKIGRLKNAF